MINKNYTKEQLLELYNKTPKDIQGILLDKNLGPAISVIGKDAGLTALQSLEIEDSVMDVLLGVSNQKDITKDIISKLNIPIDTASKIIKDIDENIFSGIKESLAKITGEEIKIEEQKKELGTEIKVPLVKTPTTNKISEERKKIAIKELSEPLRQPTIKQSNTTPTRHIPVNSSTQPTVITPHTKNSLLSNIPPQPPTQIKTIVGGEKVGISTPSPEHQFEKKLRSVLGAPEEKETERKPAINTPPQKKQQDPYREPLE